MNDNKKKQGSQIAQILWIFKRFCFLAVSRWSLAISRKEILSMGKPNSFQCTVSKVFSIYFNSRSGRRGRMRRHMRDNMASRGRDTGKSRPKGGRNWTSMPRAGTACSFSLFGSMCFEPFNNKRSPKSFAEDFSLPLSSPGVCCTDPPAKPTNKLFKPNRQWCGAPRGGGEGSPRALVSFRQFICACCNPSAVFTPVADRQQQKRSSAHTRTACSTARTRASWIMDLLDMIKRYNFHIHGNQQNMGTGNALCQRCLYPFLRPRRFFNSPMKPLCKLVRAKGVREMIRFMNSKEMPFRCRAGTPAGTARFFTFSAVYHNE